MKMDDRYVDFAKTEEETLGIYLDSNSRSYLVSPDKTETVDIWYASL
jgi:hypothetical protein